MKSYLKFLSRNKLYTAIEAVGLIVSLAFVIIIACYTWQQFSVSREAPDHKRIFALTTGQGDWMSAWPGELALVQDRIPDVEMGGRVNMYGTTASFDGRRVPGNPTLYEVDPEIFELLPQTFLSGGVETLNDRNQVILSESFASKISPDMDPVGKTIVVRNDTCVIGGVLRVPEHSILKESDIYLSFGEPDAPSMSEFIHPVDLVLVRLREGADQKAVRSLVDTLVTREFDKMYQVNKPETSMTVPFRELYFSPVYSGVLKKGNATLVYVLLAIGVLLLVSALFNYINLSIALSGKRAKEMAIRSTLGESKGSIRWRYITESVLFVAVCMALALLVAKSLEPLFNRYVAGDIGLHVDLSSSYLAAFAVLAVLIGLVSGLVPAWLAFRHNPVAVIKGEHRRQTKTVLSRVFIVLQNVITVTLISLALVMELQYRHLMDMPLGADVDGLYFLSSGTVGTDALAAKPYVDRIGKSEGFPGKGNMGFTTTVNGQKAYVGMLQCDETAFDMFGFDIVEDFGTPRKNSLWFTESAARLYSVDRGRTDLPDPFPYLAPDSHIGGIIKDYAVKGPTELEGNQFGAVSVEALEGNSSVILKLNRFDADVRAELKEIGREESLRLTGNEDYGEKRYGYIPELIEKGMEKTRNFISLIELFMSLSTMISLLGLVAMSAYYAGMQTKDIAVRKVFGGSVASETGRSVKEYMVLVGIAVLVGVPIAIFLAERYLRQFWYRIDGYGWVFAAGALIALVISFLAVLGQTLKAARTNPAEELKKE